MRRQAAQSVLTVTPDVRPPTDGETRMLDTG